MHVDLFNFDLPDEAIALRPAHPREAARLLRVGTQKADFQDHIIADLPDLLQPGDALVLNNTKVIPAQLTGRRQGGLGGRVHVNLHARISASSWRAFARPARKLKVGERISFGTQQAGQPCFAGVLEAEIAEKGEGGEILLRFDLAGPVLDDAIKVYGVMPLPPYISSKREIDASDARDYQTEFAEIEGAVAAPTAGLHITQDLLTKLKDKGVGHYFVTLHVGAGTFLPVKTENISDHKMHSEWGEVTSDAATALNKVHADGGRIIAVGTTSARLLETASDGDGTIKPFSGMTDIFMAPGYRFKAVDMLLTNFHLPRSSLFMLVAAFSGLDHMKRAYAHALKTGYRFYSYGDACLLTCLSQKGTHDA